MGNGSGERTIRMNPETGDTEMLIAVPTSDDHQSVVWTPLHEMEKVEAMYRKWGAEKARVRLAKANAALEQIPASDSEYAKLLQERDEAQRIMDTWTASSN
jgi:hypothetical protein